MKKYIAIFLAIASVASMLAFSAFGETTGNSETEIIISHDYKAWEHDEETHWRLCNDCSGTFNYGPHQFNDKGDCICGYHTELFKYGDANGDKEVDMNDIVLLRQYVANYDYDLHTSTVEVKLGADANGDKSIDMNDIVLLRQYVANYDYDTKTSTVVLGPQDN